MRPHRLRLTAFGPFAGTVEVDLDALAESGLFLLHGETGAGKTTLLDGLGFALFGRVPGARQQGKRLRSDHADPSTRTEVRLEATLSGRRVRVTRSPEQDRAKVRGAGTTREPAKVLLEEHDGAGWTPVSTRVGEADRELGDLVGMSAEQFFQVVLLPQGEFARFLRAGSEERGALLERLFATDRFRAVEQWLGDRRRATHTARESAQDVVARLAARVAQVADVDEPDAPIDRAWAQRLAATAAQQAEAATREALRHQAALDQALAADEQERQLGERQQRRRVALDEQARLEAEAGEVAVLGQQAEAAARAAEVASLLDDVSRRRAALTAADTACAAAADQLPEELRGACTDSLRAAAARSAERAGRLEALQDHADRAAAEDALAAAAAHRADEAGRQREQLASRLVGLPERRRAAEQRRDAAHEAAVRLPSVRAQAERLRALAAAAHELAAGREQLAQLQAEHLCAREAAADARQAAQDLRDARFEAMVGELAALLVDGDPCLVCGGRDHPEPAEVQGAPVGREQEQAAQQEAERLAAVAQDLGVRVSAAEATCAALAARTGEVEEAALAARAAALEQQADALDTQAASAAPAAAEVDACEAEASTLAAGLVALEAEKAGAHAQQSEAAARAAQARAAVTEHLLGAADLAEARARVAAAVAVLERAMRAGEQQAACALEAQRAERTAADAARAAGFPDVEQAGAARRDAAWRTAAGARTRAHAEAVAAVQALLAEPDLDVALEPAADTEASGTSVRAEREAQADAAALAGRLEERARQLSDLLPQLSAALGTLAPLAQRAAEVKALADLANGQGANTLRMTLSAYVLAARLEEVAAVASERLLRMTQGRYSLVHTDAGRGSAKAGLGLLARDTWTGHDRDTSTLSGGETFLASLALALGLADVVAAEAGGARTEALFVDEGFGTLDEETLEEVMDVLDGLREGGRLVGVVSHVAELRQRIPAQVHVRKSRTGSQIALLGC
jgi:DNA repair protein SbcC/Rad50